METTPVKLLTEQINYYHTFKEIVIDKYRNGKITELKKDSVICDTDKQIQMFEDAVKNLTPQPKPRAKKKALRLFGVVRSALYVIICTTIMILLDNHTELSQPLSWWLGWLMATIYTIWINKRK